MSDVQVSRVVVGKRIRSADPAKVAELAASIAEIGLLNPITVAIPGNHLIAGLHRLEAVKRLGWKDVPANVLVMSDDQRALAEIDENLIRNDLTVLQRSEHLAARKRIYERLHPETRHGGAPGKAGGGKVAKEPGVGSFVSDTVGKTGIGKSTIKEEVQIGSMPEAVREAAAKTEKLADSKTDLLLLSQVAKKDEATAVKVAAKVATGEARNVKEAIAQARVESKHEERKGAAWTASEEQRREMVLAGGIAVANQSADPALLAWAKETGRLVLIDRTSDWGNPFILGDDGDRDYVIESFAIYLRRTPSLLKRLPSLAGKVLACWCHPERCHGEEIADAAL